MEAADVFKEKMLEALDRLVERRQPRPGGEMYLNHLRNKIQSESVISAREIIEHLVSAGYTLDDVLYFFYSIGMITSSDDWVRYRDAVRRVMMTMERE